jgi:hypothetical protein
MKYGTFKYGTGVKYGSDNGKIIYSPISTVALALDEAHSLTIGNAAFNAGRGPFGIDILLQIDSSSIKNQVLIASKYPGVWQNQAGWGVYYRLDNRSLGFIINDGSGAPVEVTTNTKALPVIGTPTWVSVRTNRISVAFYVNGVEVGSGDISSKTGSLDNNNPLTIGGQTDFMKGRIDFIRFDQGRCLPAEWHADEWYRIVYGCPRVARDFTAFWTFYGQSLLDLGGTHELIWQGGGSQDFVMGWPAVNGSISYVFEESFTFDIEPGRLDLDDNQRMSNGSAFNYPHPNQKKTFILPFQYILPTQQAAFEAAWAAKQPIDLYLRGGRPKENGQFQIMKYPLVKYVFSNRMDAELDLEQT